MQQMKSNKKESTLTGGRHRGSERWKSDTEYELIEVIIYHWSKLDTLPQTVEADY